MGVPIPLGVRLFNSDVDRHVTRDLRDLSFREVVNGGYASMTFSLDRPLHVTAPELALYTDADVYDLRTGKTAWNGWLEDQGQSADSNGVVYDVSAIGPSAHANEIKRPYILADASSGGWERRPPATPAVNFAKNGFVEIGSSESGLVTLIRIGVREGETVDASVNDKFFIARYRRLIDAGMKLARAHFAVQTGFNNPTQWDMNIYTRQSFTGSGTQAATAGVDGTTLTLEANIVDGDFSNGANVVELSLVRRSGNTTISDENTDVTASRLLTAPGLMIVALREDKSGNEITTGSTSYDDLTHQNIVEDLLGRMLPLYDGANATIGTSSITHSFRQFAYPDPITARQALEDVIAVHSDMYWAATDRQPDGTYEFEWANYGTTPRYVISARDGYQAPLSAADVYNEAVVRYRLPSGGFGHSVRTNTVSLLETAGRIRTVPVDVGDNLGESADDVGDAQLAGHDTPQGGTLVVARPVLNRDTGIIEEPWEIRPGCQVMIAETGRIHTVIAKDYRVSAAAATLELDQPATTSANQIAGRVPLGRLGPVGSGSNSLLSHRRR